MGIAPDVLVGTSLSALIALLVPVVVYLALRKRMQLRWRNILVGAGIFIVMVVVLESSMHAYLLQANPTTKAWFEANLIGYAIYGALAAALFEETGRYIGFRFLAKPVSGNGTPVAYAIGHGGIECILVGINIAVVAVLGYLMMTGQGASLNLPADVAATIQKSLTEATFLTSFYGGLERISAFIFHLGWSLLVWQAVSRRKFIYFLAAVAGHFAIDFPAVLAQKKVLALSIGEIEAGYALLAALFLIAIWAFAPRGEDTAATPPTQSVH